MQDVVLAAARRIADAGEHGNRVVSLAQVRADTEVQRHVNTASRVTDIMNELERSGQVRMISRHPEPRWRVNPS